MVSFFNGISTSVGYLMPSHPSQRAAVMLFNPLLAGQGCSYLSQGYFSESEWTSKSLRFCSLAL